jgi:hypothetical protein
MNNIIKSAIFVMALALSANVTFGQEEDRYVMDWNYDEVTIIVGNMGNLPTNNPSITAKWLHNAHLGHPEPYWTSCPLYLPNFLPGEYPLRGNPAPNNWLEGSVTVILGGGRYIATKYWQAPYMEVTFTASDFHSLWDEVENKPIPIPDH